MTNFNYTARDKSGALKHGCLRVANRVAALAELKAQGLVPLSVEEGKAKRPQSGSKDLILKRPLLLLAGGVVALLAVWVALRLLPGAKANVARPKTHKEQAGKAAKAKPAPRVNEAKNTPPKPSKPAVETPPEPLRPAVEVPALITPPATNRIARRVSPKGDRIVVPGIRRNGGTNAPNPYATFRTTSERMMSGMLSAKPGEMIIGVSLGRDFDKDFAASLTNSIEIYASDTEEMAAHKEAVAWLKDDIRKLAKEGQSPEEILTAFRNQHNEVAKFRSELQSKLSELKKEGKMEEAEAFAKEANKLLEPYGTRPLTVFPALPSKKAK